LTDENERLQGQVEEDRLNGLEEAKDMANQLDVYN
jgi:hypothetical protein